MLQLIREHLTGWVAVLLLGLIALSFVFFGIDFRGAGANTALRINGEEVPRYRLENVVRARINEIQRQQPDAITPSLEETIRAQSIDALINQAVVRQAAEEQGFRVSEDRLEREIRNIPAFQVGGEFDPEAYFNALNSAGRTAASFEADVRRDLQRQQVQTTFESTSFVTPEEIRRRIALINQTRTIDYLRIPVGLAMAEVEVTEEDIQARYEAFPSTYTEPEQVTLQYLELRVEDVAQEMEVDEAEVRAAYEAGVASERFRVPEERRASHILIAATDEQDPAAARAQAQALVEDLAAGADFAALAAEYSDDPVSAGEGGDLGWVSEGTLEESLVEAIFETAPGEVSGPVQTSFGFHVVRVEDIRGGDVTPFEEVREDLVAEVQTERAENLFIDRGEELAELTFQNSRSLAPAAQALGLELQEVEGVTERSGVGVAADVKVREAAFTPEVLEEGLNSDVVELDLGHLVVLRVTDRTPARLRPLEEVRDQIESVVRAEKARTATRERGAALTDRVRSGESLAALAETLGEGLEPVMDYELKRQSREVPTQLVQAVFAAPTPAPEEAVVGGQPLIVGDYVIYRLTAVDNGELDDDAVRGQVRARLEQEQSVREYTAYLAALKEDAKVFVARGLREGREPAR